AAGDPLEEAAGDALGAVLEGGVLRQHLLPRGSQQAVEAAEDGEGEDDLAVLVALVGTAEQVADVPDEAGELGVSFCGHAAGLTGGQGSGPALGSRQTSGSPPAR